MLNPNALEILRIANEWLDNEVSDKYKDQPLAQDWARVAKITEEHGEAIDALIRWTGQNPRKPSAVYAKNEMLDELADVVVTACLAIQHFTRDMEYTEAHIEHAFIKVLNRAIENGYTPKSPELVE